MFPLRDTQPSYSKPVVTVLLIVVNILVFLFEVPAVEVPAWLMLIWWFFIQFFNGVGTIGNSSASHGGGVAFLAHVGGFLAGIALIYLLVPRRGYARRQDV